MEGAKTHQSVLAVNIPQGSTRRKALEMVHYQSSKFAKQVDNEALKEKAKKCGDGSQEANIPGASLAASREAITQ